MNFDDLKNPELQKKLMSAKTPDEMVALVKERGVELTDEQMEKIAGGYEWTDTTQYYHTCGTCGREVVWTESSGRPNYCPFCGVEKCWE